MGPLRSNRFCPLSFLVLPCRLLHPFMPFVTEELWQRLPHPHTAFPNAVSPHPTQPQAPSNGSHTAQNGHSAHTSSIMMQPYPEPQQSWQNSKVEESMQLADTVIRAVRKLRNDYGLQRQRPQLFIQVVTASCMLYVSVQHLMCLSLPC